MQCLYQSSFQPSVNTVLASYASKLLMEAYPELVLDCLSRTKMLCCPVQFCEESRKVRTALQQVLSSVLWTKQLLMLHISAVPTSQQAHLAQEPSQLGVGGVSLSACADDGMPVLKAAEAKLEPGADRVSLLCCFLRFQLSCLCFLPIRDRNQS